MQRYQPIGNGLRTDHPVPDLPFVDDSVLPIDDGPGIEAIGRRSEEGTWGRYDRNLRGDPGWRAFTTDQTNRDLAWLVRWHPDYGRSVLLFRDDDIADVHMDYEKDQVLYRSGGYWWDGTTWFRPSQLWDAAAEEYRSRPVRGASTITAADILPEQSAAAAAAANLRSINKTGVLTVDQIDPNADDHRVSRWATEHLTRWAEHRSSDGLPLDQSVIALNAPELAGDQLVGVPEFAELAGIAPATLRAYISRDEGEIPLPQAVVQGARLWSKPVVEDWILRRSHSTESSRLAVMGNIREIQKPIGITELWEQFASSFYDLLWDRDLRKRWALRWRTPSNVRETAEALAWDVAGDLRHIVPVDALGPTIKHAIQHEFATQKASEYGDGSFYGLLKPFAQMLDWLIRHEPEYAHAVLAEIVGDNERAGIPRAVTTRSIRTALGLDSKLPDDALTRYLDAALPWDDDGE